MVVGVSLRMVVGVPLRMVVGVPLRMVMGVSLRMVVGISPRSYDRPIKNATVRILKMNHHYNYMAPY